MQKKITFRGMDHLASLENFSQEQLEKIYHFLANEQTPLSVELILESNHRPGLYKVELKVKSPNYDRVTHYEFHDMYDCISRVVDTMYKELHEDKKRHVEDRKMTGRHEDFKKQR